VSQFDAFTSGGPWPLVAIPRVCCRLEFHRRDEAVPDARHRLDERLAGGPFPEQLPQDGDVVIEIVLLDRRVRPNGLQQLFLGDQPSGIFDQHPQRVEHLQAQWDGLAVAQQATLGNLEPKRPESVSLRGGRHDFRIKSEISNDAQRTRPAHLGRNPMVGADDRVSTAILATPAPARHL
jgi:hypothetical protein